MTETIDQQKTNREAWEEAAGYGLIPLFFEINGIDPDAPCDPPNDAAQAPKSPDAAGSPVTIEQMIGGGDSWFYALQNGKVLGAAHKDDYEAMQRLRDIQKANAPAEVRSSEDKP